MPQTSPSAKPCLFENLEPRKLLSISVTGFGAVPNDGADDTAAIQSAIRAAMGGEVTFPAGTYNVSSTLTVGSDTTLTGAAGSKLDFHIGRTSFAIDIDSNSSNVTIQGLAIKSNDGIISMNHGTLYSNVHIINNDFQWGYDGTYFHRLAVQATTRSTGTVIEHNYFHDSSLSDRNVDLWRMSNASYSYNKFYYVNDGGHICDSGDNVKFVGNVGRKIHRMGIEIQTWNGNTTNMLVANNVFWDWDRPWMDSFGLSVMPQSAHNVQVLNNYISATFDGVWGAALNGEQRFGIGIEAGFTTGIVKGNTVIGPWCWAISSSMPSMLFQDNQIFGRNVWAALSGEAGQFGTGSFISVNNLINRLQSAAPGPDSFIAAIDGLGDLGDWGSGGGGDTGGGGTGGDGTDTGGPPPTGISPFLTGFVNDSTRITLSWIDGYTDESGYRVERSLTGAAGSFTRIWDSSAPNVTYYQDTSLPSGTKLWYRVIGYKNNGVGQYSNVIAATTKGAPSNGGGGGSGGTGGSRVTQSFTPGGSVFSNNGLIPGIDPNDNNFFGDTGLL